MSNTNNIVVTDPFLDDPTLADPDAERELQYEDDENIQTLLLGALTEDAELLAYAKDHIKPRYFTERTNQKICKILLEYWQRFEELPSKEVLCNEVAKQAKDAAEKVCLLGKVNVLEYLEGLHPKKYLFHQIEQFAKKSMALKLTKNMIDAQAEGDFQKCFQMAAEGMNKIQSTFNNEQNLFCDLLDLKIEAEKNPIQWVIQNWLMFGGLHLCSGHSFAGKSVLWAEMAGFIAEGLPFGGLQTTQTPLLIIDLENHSSIIHRRFSDSLGNGEEVTWVTKEQLRMMLPLDPKKIKRLITQFYDKTGNSRCLLLIDTFRSAFNIDEYDPKEIGELLYPLQTVAQETNCALVLLHHRPKTNADYAGHNAMMAALDFFMVYERDKMQGTLRMAGTRLDQPDPIHLTFNPISRRLCPNQKNESNLDQLIIEIVGQHDGLSQQEVNNRVRSSFADTVGVNKLRARIDDLAEQGLIHRRGQHGKGGYSYFSSDR